jgi:hypothetical protein
VTTETEIETAWPGLARRECGATMFAPGESGGGCGIRTREGVNPTRFPSERHRPLGESSARKATGKGKSGRTAGCTRLLYAVHGMHAMYSANIPRYVGYQRALAEVTGE